MERTLLRTPYVNIASLWAPVRKLACQTWQLLQDGPPATRRQRQALGRMHQALNDAKQEIERLAACNEDIHQQLEIALQREAQAREDACRDPLTGLPNRRLLKDRLQQAMAHGARQHKQVALLLIDLDGFKGINDTLGHAAGDQLLRAFSQRLSAALRAADTACRYGGDEFVVLLPELHEHGTAEAAIRRISEWLDTPYLIGGRKMTVQASIGCAVYWGDGCTYEELIARADADMYRVKMQRKSQQGSQN